MDSLGISAASTASSAMGSLRGAVGVSLLKTAMDAQAQSVLSMIASIPQVTPAANLPAHLGQNINTTA
jgi:hypothetical protein